MLHQLLFFVSYSALLLLLIPTKAADIILTAVVFVSGTWLIIRRKTCQNSLWNVKTFFFIPAAVLIVRYCGGLFYDRWLSLAGTQIPEAPLLIASWILSILSVYIVCAGLHRLYQKLTDPDPGKSFEKSLICCLLAAAVTVSLSQVMIGVKILAMGYLNFLWGVLIVSAVIVPLYCLLGRITPAAALGAGVFMILSSVNVYVYRFRRRLFEPVDIFSAETAMNVADNYSLLPLPKNFLLCWGIFAAMVIILCCLHRRTKPHLTARRRLALLGIFAVSATAVFCCAAYLKTYHWYKQGAENNGYILDYVSKFKEISAARPKHYSGDLIAGLAEQYADGREGPGHDPSELPHIIVIMDEAFSDLGVVGNFSTNTDVTPFISSLRENTISGYTLTSVYGGNTANSEYEFLTGNSLAWLSPNVVPYQQYLRAPAYSMVSYLKSAYDYQCLAMHPYTASGWNRPAAYGHLGFDECYFVDDFPQKDYIRKYISDREMFDFLIETYEARKDDPLFIFGVTMQNHGDYAYTGENFTKSISLAERGSEFPEVEQYLSLIHETDKAVEHLITYFQGAEDDVVIVFFGDHQPKLNNGFHEAISGTAMDTLDDQQKIHTVPFFIWANYDIEEAYIDRTSLNYLSSYMYEAAGITAPPFNRFLREMEAVIPAINANGFYSPGAGCYLPLNEADGEQQRWLDLYEALQYNNMFDRKNQNELLFPLLDE